MSPQDHAQRGRWARAEGGWPDRWVWVLLSDFETCLGPVFPRLRNLPKWKVGRRKWEAAADCPVLSLPGPQGPPLPARPGSQASKSWGTPQQGRGGGPEAPLALLGLCWAIQAVRSRYSENFPGPEWVPCCKGTHRLCPGFANVGHKGSQPVSEGMTVPQGVRVTT